MCHALQKRGKQDCKQHFVIWEWGRLGDNNERRFSKYHYIMQNLRSHSEPLQGRHWGVRFFQNESALEPTPCHSPLKTFTLYNPVGHQTQGNVMSLRLGLRIRRLLGRPRVTCLTALEVELTFHYPDDLFDISLIMPL